MAAILKMAPTGSPSQFSDGGIHFTCSDKSQEQNKIGLIRHWGTRGGGDSLGTMDYIKPVVNYRFELIEGPLIKGQFSQLAIGIDTSSFQFWKLHTPLINLI